jgi:hypothetical protein
MDLDEDDCKIISTIEVIELHVVKTFTKEDLAYIAETVALFRCTAEINTYYDTPHHSHRIVDIRPCEGKRRTILTQDAYIDKIRQTIDFLKGPQVASLVDWERCVWYVV